MWRAARAQPVAPCQGTCWERINDREFTKQYLVIGWHSNSRSLQEAGHGDPVVLVHGFGASAKQWRRMIPELAQRHKVCVHHMAHELQRHGLKSNHRIVGVHWRH
jgi:pimeloyl-ACP methyl ester carboxylesterase